MREHPTDVYDEAFLPLLKAALAHRGPVVVGRTRWQLTLAAPAVAALKGFAGLDRLDDKIKSSAKRSKRKKGRGETEGASPAEATEARAPREGRARLRLPLQRSGNPWRQQHAIKSGGASESDGQ